MEPRLVFDGSLPTTLTESTPVTVHAHTGSSSGGNGDGSWSADQGGDIVLGTAVLSDGSKAVLWGSLTVTNYGGFMYYEHVGNVQLSIIDTSNHVTTTSLSFSGANDPTNRGNGICIVMTSMNDGGFVIAENAINADSNNGGTTAQNGNIFYEVFNNSGTVTKSWTRLNLTAGDASSNGDVELQAGPTGFVAAWAENDMQNIYFERFDNSGAATSSAIDVTSSAMTWQEWNDYYHKTMTYSYQVSMNFAVDGYGNVAFSASRGSIGDSQELLIYNSSNTVIANTTLATIESGKISSPGTIGDSGGLGFTPLATGGFITTVESPTSSWGASGYSGFTTYFQEINISAGGAVTYATPYDLGTTAYTPVYSGTLLSSGYILFDRSYSSYSGASDTYLLYDPANLSTAPTTPVPTTLSPSGAHLVYSASSWHLAISADSTGGFFAALQKSTSGFTSYYGTPLDCSLYAADFGNSTPANTAPSFSHGDNSTSYTEGGSAVILNGSVTATDSELASAGNYNGAVLTLARHGGANSNDVFNVDGSTVTLSGSNVVVGATTVGTFSETSGTATLTFNANATGAVVNTVLEHITYSDTSTAPPASLQVDWTLNDGNTGSQGTGGALSGTTTTTVSAVVPAPSTPDLATGSDSGSSHTDNITNVGKPVIQGTGLNGLTVDLYDGATLIGSGTVSGGTWSIDLSSLASPLSDGTHTLTAKQVDGSSHTSVSSSALDITIDTSVAAPAVSGLTPGTDSGSSHTDGITNVVKPTIAGTGEVGATVTVLDGVTTLGTATVDGSGNWTLDLSSDPALSSGSHSITATQTDVAGNVSGASSAFTVTIDTTVAAPVVSGLTSATDSGSSHTDGITNVVKPTITGTGEVGATVTVLDGSTTIGTATVDGSGNWSLDLTSGSALSSGSHSITATQTDVAGNASAASSPVSVTIDSTAPAAPASLALLPATDSGTKGDGITKITAPIIKGTAEANSTVAVYDGATLLGTATADGSGNWAYVVPTALSNGTHSITATATDAAGNTGPASGAFSLTIDNVAPAAPTSLGIAAATDSGTKGDGITKITAPIIKGTAEANSTVAVYDGATLLGTTTADGSGCWAYVVPTALSNGTHSITAKATDAAANTSVASSVFSLTIDNVAPAAPTSLGIAAATDSGTKGDGITKITAPIIKGSAEANSTVAVYDGATLLGTATADSSGCWAFLVPSPLSNGTHSITAKATDAAANTSVASSVFSLTIDSVAPAAPTSLGIAAATDSGTKGDGITRIAAPIIKGNAEANSTVTVYDGATLLGTTTADSSGCWAFLVPSPLSNGTHSITAKATDAAANTSVASSVFTLKIDPTA